MTHDMDIAIAEGATIVRVGTEFGDRRRPAEESRTEQIAFIGGGNMAEAILGGLLASGGHATAPARGGHCAGTPCVAGGNA